MSANLSLQIEAVKKVSRGQSVLLVEDDHFVRETTQELLSMVYDTLFTASNGREGINLYSEKKPDIVISDLDMPVMNGIEMIKMIHNIDPSQQIIVISGHNDSDNLIDLINLGVHTFVPKPFRHEQLLQGCHQVSRIIHYSVIEKDYQRQLEEDVRKKTLELSSAMAMLQEFSDEIVQRLSATAEYRDTDTGHHIERTAWYADHIAEVMELDNDFRENLLFASPLHDIGKIGIPDTILLKKDQLDKAEFKIMKTHTTIGANILKDSKNPKIQYAHSVALTHHERWDGSGYPAGLSGNDIPVEGRIVAICDVYDALRSCRPYKKSLSHNEAVDIMLNGDSSTSPNHFDPAILQIFRDTHAVFKRIYDELADHS